MRTPHDPEEARVVAQLWAEGKTVSEIAEAIGATKGVVSGLIHRMKVGGTRPVRVQPSRPKPNADAWARVWHLWDTDVSLTIRDISEATGLSIPAIYLKSVKRHEANRNFMTAAQRRAKRTEAKIPEYMARQDKAASMMRSRYRKLGYDVPKMRPWDITLGRVP